MKAKISFSRSEAKSQSPKAKAKIYSFSTLVKRHLHTIFLLYNYWWVERGYFHMENLFLLRAPNVSAFSVVNLIQKWIESVVSDILRLIDNSEYVKNIFQVPYFVVFAVSQNCRITKPLLLYFNCKTRTVRTPLNYLLHYAAREKQYKLFYKVINIISTFTSFVDNYYPSMDNECYR